MARRNIPLSRRHRPTPIWHQVTRDHRAIPRAKHEVSAPKRRESHRGRLQLRLDGFTREEDSITGSRSQCDQPRLRTSRFPHRNQPHRHHGNESHSLKRSLRTHAQKHQSRPAGFPTSLPTARPTYRRKLDPRPTYKHGSLPLPTNHPATKN